MTLGFRLALRFALGWPVAVAVVLLPAGSPKFWQGWLFVGLFLAASAFLTFWLYRHDPRLLERRLLTKEKMSEQKLFKVLWVPLWIAALSLPGLDYRFGWSRAFGGEVPLWLTLLSQGLVLCGFFLIFQVLRVNTFASSVIQVEAGQRVISDGPYRLVRHPMYSGILLLVLFAPLALGSYIALPVFALLIPLLVFRLIHEEKTLLRELPGYSAYCEVTRYRLVPFVY
jgi:protein-S-isoprenylcysteine O-methyltransferase Ste14